MTKEFCDICGALALKEVPAKEEVFATEVNKQHDGAWNKYNVLMFAPRFQLVTIRNRDEDRASVSHLCAGCYNMMIEKLKVKIP